MQETEQSSKGLYGTKYSMMVCLKAILHKIYLVQFLVLYPV